METEHLHRATSHYPEITDYHVNYCTIVFNQSQTCQAPRSPRSHIHLKQAAYKKIISFFPLTLNSLYVETVFKLNNLYCTVKVPFQRWSGSC